jgi:hypothetical protein
MRQFLLDRRKCVFAQRMALRQAAQWGGHPVTYARIRLVGRHRPSGSQARGEFVDDLGG